MARRYYSSRKSPASLTARQLYDKLVNLYLLLRGKDYFKQKAGITDTHVPDAIRREAALALTFQPFPIEQWGANQVNADNIFDTLELLYDYVSSPGPREDFVTDDGWNYTDYARYDEVAGRADFRSRANAFLPDYRPGYELTEEGTILALGSQGLAELLNADIIPFDEVNVDSKVRHAILRWRNRHL